MQAALSQGTSFTAKRQGLLLKAMLALLVVSTVTSVASAADARQFMLKASLTWDPKECKIYGNSPLHVIMDRVCLMCHEMYSHERPNMRVECRSECFSSDHFRDCLGIFSPSERARALPTAAEYQQ